MYSHFALHTKTARLWGKSNTTKHRFISPRFRIHMRTAVSKVFHVILRCSYLPRSVNLQLRHIIPTVPFLWHFFFMPYTVKRTYGNMRNFSIVWLYLFCLRSPKRCLVLRSFVVVRSDLKSQQKKDHLLSLWKALHPNLGGTLHTPVLTILLALGRRAILREVHYFPSAAHAIPTSTNALSADCGLPHTALLRL